MSNSNAAPIDGRISNGKGQETKAEVKLVEVKPDARLVHLHAERGDPQGRLISALCDLEEADWGMLCAGEGELARQLAHMLGEGALRVDGRVPLSQQACAEAGLALAPLHGDLTRARAVWLFEPEQATIDRARKLNVPIIVDSTLAPGSHWLDKGADLVVYRDAATLSGHGDVLAAALFGRGTKPVQWVSPPSDLHVSLLLRDIATLPLRLARASRITGLLLERLGKEAIAAGPTALLLPPDRLADTLQPLGGVRAAARHVAAGLLLTPGLQDASSILALVRQRTGLSSGATMGVGTNEPTTTERIDKADKRATEREDRESRDTSTRPESRHEGRADGRADSDEGREKQRPVWPKPRTAPVHRSEERASRFTPQPSRPAVPTAPSVPAVPQLPPQRVTFEAPEVSAAPQAKAEGAPQKQPPQEQQGSKASTWEPEIVFSPNPPRARQPIPMVSSGPDPDDAVTLRVKEALTESSDESSEQAALLLPEHVPQDAQRTEMLEIQAQPERVIPKPDLPSPTQQASELKADLNEEQLALYERLRTWRDEQAARQRVSRFIVMSNTTLVEIVKRLPLTREEFGSIKGIGESRLEYYGADVLQLVRRHLEKAAKA